LLGASGGFPERSKIGTGQGRGRWGKGCSHKLKALMNFINYFPCCGLAWEDEQLQRGRSLRYGEKVLA